MFSKLLKRKIRLWLFTGWQQYAHKHDVVLQILVSHVVFLALLAIHLVATELLANVHSEVLVPAIFAHDFGLPVVDNDVVSKVTLSGLDISSRDDIDLA